MYAQKPFAESIPRAQFESVTFTAFVGWVATTPEHTSSFPTGRRPVELFRSVLFTNASETASGAGRMFCRPLVDTSCWLFIRKRLVRQRIWPKLERSFRAVPAIMRVVTCTRLFTVGNPAIVPCPPG